MRIYLKENSVFDLQVYSEQWWHWFLIWLYFSVVGRSAAHTCSKTPRLPWLSLSDAAVCVCVCGRESGGALVGMVGIFLFCFLRWRMFASFSRDLGFIGVISEEKEREVCGAETLVPYFSPFMIHFSDVIDDQFPELLFHFLLMNDWVNEWQICFFSCFNERMKALSEDLY